MHLSEFELDVMQVVWQNDECSAPEVHARLPSNRKKAAYSTVKTIIDRLERKGALERTRTDKGTIFFRAAVTSEVVQDSMLATFVKHVFAGDKKPLFSRLLKDERLSRDDIEYLEDLIAKLGDVRDPSTNKPEE